MNEFTDKQMLLATIQLQSENNAMLRLLLSNQIKIMQKLEMDTDIAFHTSVYADLMPGTATEDHGLMQKFVEFIQGTEGQGGVTELVKKRIWEWALMNDK